MTLATFADTLLAYLIAINVIAFALCVYDKMAAIAGARLRVPESALLGLSGIGGSAGAKIVGLLWGHKRLRHDFVVSLNLIVLVQVGLVAALWMELGGWRDRFDIGQGAQFVAQSDDRAMPRRFGPGS